MICIRFFLEFLAEFDCLGAYWSNFEKSCLADNHCSAASFISLVFEKCPHRWLLCSFEWEHSDEGPEYWSNLDTLWNKYCDFLLKNG